MTSVQKKLPLLAIAIAAAGKLPAQVPSDLAKQIANIGPGLCFQETALLYRPLHPGPPYTGVTITRDISFGPDPKNVLDLFEPENGGGSRPVLIYVSGGAGNKRAGGANGDIYYDNIMLWAVQNGMVGVNMQRRPGQAWDDPARDIALMVQWVGQNIAQHKGNPGRVFIWAQSAGNVPTATYIAHSEFWGPKGVGVTGVVFMSPPAFDILPATPPMGLGGFTPCRQADGTAAAAPPSGPGRSAGTGGGRGKGGDQPDAATQLARSNLPGLMNSKVSFIVIAAELDPPNIIGFSKTLKDELCRGRCPAFLDLKVHSHVSEVMAPNTADDSVTGPILKWMKSVK
jgi:Carboxylesterase family